MLRFATALLFVSCSYFSAGPARAETLIQGHRGARARRPENTLAAFLYAIKVGADVLEMDVHATRDDVLVVSHDPTINPALCGWRDGREVQGRIAIRDTPYARIRQLDCGSRKNPRFPQQKRAIGSRMPSLVEVLKATATKRSRRSRLMRFNIETKIVPGEPQLSPNPRRFAQLLLRVLRKHKIVDRTTVQSFDARTLEALRALEPKLALALLTDGNYVDYALLAKRYGVRVISPHHRWILKADVQKLRKMGVRVAPWTVNDPAEWKRLIEMGVHSIITDDPGALWRAMGTK